MKLGINKDISNAEYHADRMFLSSSSLKEILKSPKAFHEKYILNIPQEQRRSSALEIGTATHTAILEPHLFDSDVAVYDGPIARGKNWDDCLLQNQGRQVITKSEKMMVDKLFNAYELNRHAVELINKCEAFEHTLCAEVEDINLKARFDGISISNGFILDVKTTGKASGLDIFKESINSLYYDLSAFMYCLIAELIYKKPFDFYFIVISKLDGICMVYKLSNSTRKQGKDNFYLSLREYKQRILTNDWSDAILEVVELPDGIMEV